MRFEQVKEDSINVMDKDRRLGNLVESTVSNKTMWVYFPKVKCLTEFQLGEIKQQLKRLNYHERCKQAA